MEEKQLVNKTTMKLFLLFLKVMPMCIAFIFLVNTVLSYFDIYPKILNYLIILLLFGFVYFASYVLHFCEYHRMFLHYCVVINIISVIDYYIGIPVSDFVMLMIYSIITIICLFLFLYFKKIRK